MRHEYLYVRLLQLSKKDELSKERKEILNSFPTLDEETVNENFVNNLSFIDYAWGVILNDCEYDLKRELFYLIIHNWNYNVMRTILNTLLTNFG